MEYEPVIGLEIHTELKTRTKMFCDSLNEPDEKRPNKNICPICMGHPGTLPAMNREAIEKVILMGLALHGSIATISQFARKNYFYPDLPKGYQISQYNHPLVEGGHIEVIKADGQRKTIRVQRIHLEEDTGRSIHSSETQSTLLDFNRAGVPLMELVTEPDITDAEEATLFAEELQNILKYLEVSHANMEKGEMRIEANVSVRKKGAKQLGTKVELKNINSFRFVEQAINYEIKRQIHVLERGGAIRQETRGWNEEQKASVMQRLKEESQDYRYFPEPDLTPLSIPSEKINELKASLPELPREKLRRFLEEYKLDAAISKTLMNDRNLAKFFEESISELQESITEEPKAARAVALAANYLTTDVIRILKGESIKNSPMTPEKFAELITCLALEKISSKTAKEVLGVVLKTGGDPSQVIDERGLWQVSDPGEFDSVILSILQRNEKAVLDFKGGKVSALQFLVGQVMKEARDANPEIIRKHIEMKLRT